MTAGGPPRSPTGGHGEEPYEDTGNQPTDIIPRRPPLPDQQTTALPRPARPGQPGGYRPAPPNPSYGPPGYPAPPPTGWPASGPPAVAPRRYDPDDDPAFPAGADLPTLDATSVQPTLRAPAPAFDSPTVRAPSPRGAHLPPYSEPVPPTTATPPPGQRMPRKLTVTRVAALRGRELTLRGVDLFHRAATADGADQSGLAHLTYAQMANYACDAALAVALANTLFLVKPEEGPGRVLLYLLITVAPFALIAPLIGPMLDRLQTGRRLALAVSMAGRGVLAIPMIFLFTGDTASWVLYPCALGSLVLSKSFTVLRASLTPRVLPESITLVATNSRLTVFGLIAGGAAGLIAGALTWMAGSPGALVFTALLGFAGCYLCLKIPSWVESTEGEVPVHLHATRNERVQLTVSVRATLWANNAVRTETGFLTMFIAFVVMKEYATESGFFKLMLLGLVGVAAGIGGFVGNALGAKLPLRSPEVISLAAVITTAVTTVLAAVMPGLAMAAVVGFVGSTASSLAKVCLDSVIQRDLPEVSRASAFGRSETALQLSWVLGGVVGLLIGGLLNLSHDPVYSIGFATVTVLMAVGIVQAWLVRSGRSMLPAIRFPGRRSRGAAPQDGRQTQRNADGTTTTRYSFGDLPTNPVSAPEPPRMARPAGSPRVDWPTSGPAGPPPSDNGKPGRRRLRHQGRSPQ